MKKCYEKPAVMIENFVLSENIASCDPSFSNNMDSIIAVSYTHLDVYKRQLLMLRRSHFMEKL